MPPTRKSARPVSYVYDNSDPESDYEPEVKKPAKRQKTKKTRSEHHDSEYQSMQNTHGKAVAHPISLHKIKEHVAIRLSLLDWYAGVHENRGMPWRKPFDPSLDAKARSQRAYEVWISEIMLQQTQVATVIPYYNRWMDKFPTITDLANSDIESVNALWKGLGYYSRAARLLSGAQKIAKEYGGLFPDNAKDMMANVPGIGRYSAGAISSIAYNHCEPVLDGNVNRLLSRVLALHANAKGKTTLDILWDGATAMVEKADRPGDINQALIELGATICKPRDPNCSACPLKDHCGAYLESRGRLPGEQDIEELCTVCEPVLSREDEGVTRYPMKIERKKAREEMDIVNVVEWLSPSGTRHFLLARRPEKGLLAGLHEFPSRADVQDANSQEAVQTIGQEVLDEVLASTPAPYNPSPEDQGCGLRITKMKPAGDVLHIFSHIRKTYRVQWILLEGTTEGSNSDPEKPPPLNPSVSTVSPSSAPTKRARGRKNKPAEDDEENNELMKEAASNKEVGLRWVKYDDVQHANIGTGVMKVWKKVNELWEVKPVKNTLDIFFSGSRRDRN